VLDPAGSDETLSLIEDRSPRKEGSGVPIRSHPEQDQIEPGPLSFLQSKERPERLLVLLGGLAGIRVLGPDAMHVLHWDRHL
jgi:hypothetical protein